MAKSSKEREVMRFAAGHPGPIPPVCPTQKAWTTDRRAGSVTAHSQAPLAITRSVLKEIERTIGDRRAEQGGMLGGDRADGIVRNYYHDASADRSSVAYSPDHVALNKLLAERWNPAGVNLLGFVHSHPPGIRQPSGADVEYALRILEAIPDLDRLLLPIVMTRPDTGRFELLAYTAVRDHGGVWIEALDVEIIDDGTPDRMPSGRFGYDTAETFRRVRSAYDLDRMAASRIICVGTGGAAAFVEDMTRAGIGEVLLIDPDVVTETNLATQQAYRRDVGAPKVAAIADRIRDINPNAKIVAHKARLDDFDDFEFTRLIERGPGRSETGTTLLCGLTDSFEAQARVNRLALNFGLPSLCGQVYHQGRGAEVTFTYPGVTPACHRCALSSRYRAYLHDGYTNDVTSDGTPIFAAGRINALLGFVALALLHHGTDHTRWGGLLGRIGNRSLVQLRMDPDLPLPVFERVFGGGDGDRILFDDVVWLPQEADGVTSGFPTCPDCGGTGDLRHAIGTFNDTMVMRS